MILLVRHAVALSRGNWNGPDRERPLSKRGRRQAEGLADTLHPFAPERIFSSPAVRCVETVLPLAKRLGVDIEERDELYEGRGTDGIVLVPGPGEEPSSVLLCSHGDVLPELLLELAGHLDDVPKDPPFAKGGAWVLDGVRGDVRSARYLPPPA